MICISCKREKPVEEFYAKHQKTEKTQSVYSECKVCMKTRNVARMTRNKVLAVEYKGGKCEKCGYNTNIKALDFHHLDPSQKDFTISTQKNTSLDRLKPELDKCILLCANCHREQHDVEYRQLADIDWTLYDDIMANGTKYSHRVTLVFYCQSHCGTKISRGSKYCAACYSKHRIEACTSTKIQWPSKEELERLVWEMPRTQLAKQLGVSDKAIAKYCERRGISQPPRGYWRKLNPKLSKDMRDL